MRIDRPSVRRGGLTLLELLVVATLITLAVGFTTISVGGMTDDATLHAAASRIGAAYRLALSEASRSGLPHLLLLERRGCRIARPAWTEAGWTWQSGASFDLPDRTRLTDVGAASASIDQWKTDPPWQIAVAPGDRGAGHVFAFEVRGGLHGVATIDPLTGTPTVRVVEEDW